MGTFTPNYRLLKAGNGTGADPVDDFVDVVSQLDRNLTMLDDFGHRAVNYQLTNNPYSTLPTTGNNVGDMMFNEFNSSIAIWNGTAWVSTASDAPVWTDVALMSTYENMGDNSTPNVGYTIENDTCTLRGRMIRTGFAIWTNGSTGVAIAAGIVPVPPTTMEYFASGGVGPSNSAQFYKISISNPTGAVSITRYGSVAQVASSINNYVDLAGISYALS